VIEDLQCKEKRGEVIQGVNCGLADHELLQHWVLCSDMMGDKSSAYVHSQDHV
jgi:hypothetical protein